MAVPCARKPGQGQGHCRHGAAVHPQGGRHDNRHRGQGGPGPPLGRQGQAPALCGLLQPRARRLGGRSAERDHRGAAGTAVAWRQIAGRQQRLPQVPEGGRLRPLRARRGEGGRGGKARRLLRAAHQQQAAHPRSGHALPRVVEGGADLPHHQGRARNAAGLSRQRRRHPRPPVHLLPGAGAAQGIAGPVAGGRTGSEC